MKSRIESSLKSPGYSFFEFGHFKQTNILFFILGREKAGLGQTALELNKEMGLKA